MSFPISTTEGEVLIVEKTHDAAGAEVLISEDGDLYLAVPGENAVPYEGDGDDLACDVSTTSDVTAIGDEPELALAQDVRHADTVADGGEATTASAIPFTEPETVTEEGTEQEVTEVEPSGGGAETITTETTETTPSQIEDAGDGNHAPEQTTATEGGTTEATAETTPAQESQSSVSGDYVKSDTATTGSDAAIADDLYGPLT